MPAQGLFPALGLHSEGEEHILRCANGKQTHLLFSLLVDWHSTVFHAGAGSVPSSGLHGNAVLFQIGTVLCSMPAQGLFPAVGLHSEGEEVRLNLDAEWEHKDVILMSIDNCEEEWSRLHDVRINGMVRGY